MPEILYKCDFCGHEKTKEYEESEFLPQYINDSCPGCQENHGMQKGRYKAVLEKIPTI